MLIENKLSNVGKHYGKVGKRLKIRKLYHNRHGYTCTEAQEMTPVRAWLRTIQVPSPLSPTVPANTETETIFMNEKMVCIVVLNMFLQPFLPGKVRNKRMIEVESSKPTADKQEVKSRECRND